MWWNRITVCINQFSLVTNIFSFLNQKIITEFYSYWFGFSLKNRVSLQSLHIFIPGAEKKACKDLWLIQCSAYVYRYPLVGASLQFVKLLSQLNNCKLVVYFVFVFVLYILFYLFFNDKNLYGNKYSLPFSVQFSDVFWT